VRPDMAIEQQLYDRPTPGSGEPLHGRVALVTGGTRGIGAAIARRLAGHGALVAAAYGHNHESAHRLQAELAAAGAPVSIHRADVASAEDCRRMVEDVIDHHGRLDILVNNAGITADRLSVKMADEDWYRVLDVNLSGAFFMARAALTHMLEQGSGRIINISSIIGQTGNIGQVNYAASKSGLFGLTMSLAQALTREPQHHGERRRAGLHRDRHARRRPREGAGEDPGPGSAGSPGPAGRGRPRRALPLRGRLVVHHRSGVGRQWWPGDVGRFQVVGHFHRPFRSRFMCAGSHRLSGCFTTPVGSRPPTR
jgi:NADP-dependent 3-hydroxy acid dehydrogenase YdfG